VQAASFFINSSIDPGDFSGFHRQVRGEAYRKIKGYICCGWTRTQVPVRIACTVTVDKMAGLRIREDL
jgi:hypothetical protein